MDLKEKFKNIGLNENAGQFNFTENFDLGYAEEATTSVIEEAAGSTTSLTPTIECIHAGMTKNYTFYSTEKLQGDPIKKTGVYSWTSPYNKPMLKNHDTKSEPLGRIVSAKFVANGITGANALQIQPKLLDQDTIEKVKNGLYQTVSIGGSTDSLTCSICGSNNITGYCDHWPGEEYDGQMCYYMVGDITFNECSFVNVPADEKAMVIDAGKQNSSESVNENNSETDAPEINAADNNIQESQEEPIQNEGGSQIPMEEEVMTPSEGEQLEEQIQETNEVEPDYEARIAELTARIAELEEDNKSRDSATISQLAESKRAFASAILQLRTKLSLQVEDAESEKTRLETRQLSSLVDTFEDLVRDVMAKSETLAPVARLVQPVESTALVDVDETIVTEEVKPEPKKAPTQEETIIKLLKGKKN